MRTYTPTNQLKNKPGNTLSKEEKDWIGLEASQAVDHLLGRHPKASPYFLSRIAHELANRLEETIRKANSENGE